MTFLFMYRSFIHNYISIMSKGKEKNCRLCLEMLEDDYNTIEEITREIFNMLLIKIDLSVTEEPLLCNSCVESVQEAFDFKCTCLAVNKQVVSLAIDRNSVELDIRDVYLKENENKNVVFNEEYNICRFCLQCLEKSNFNFLNDLRQSSADEMLLRCIPELDLNLVKDPVVCTVCMKSLETYYNFALKCRLTEENIMKYCEVQGAEHTGRISLVNVLKFLVEGAYIDDCSKTPAPEEHDMFQNGGNAYSDMNNVFKIEEVELIIKDESEYGDCKIEESRCDENRRKEIVNDDMLSRKDSLGMYRCALCTYATRTKKYLRRHMLVHKDNSEVTMYRCERCTFATKHKCSLTGHMLVHKENSEVIMYKCNLCSYESKRKRNLNTHILIHKSNSEMVMHKCNSCNYEAKWKYRLKDHMLLVHKVSSDVIYRCEKCTFETEHKTDLKKHVLIHKSNSGVVLHKFYIIKKHMLIHKDSSDANI